MSEPSSTAKTWATQSRHGAASSASTGREPTPLERKAQLAKLAEMGVAVPEDYRREVAMAGDWQTVAERPIWNGIKKEEGLEDFKDFKPDLTLNVGVRKRKLVDRDEEAEGGPTVVRKGWGSTTRRYPGSDNDNDDDLDTLLGMKPVSEQGRPIKSEESSKQPNADKPDGSQSLRETDVATQTPSVKQEDSRDGINLNSVPDQTGLPDATVKQEDEGTQPAVFFKKRKSKSSATC